MKHKNLLTERGPVWCALVMALLACVGPPAWGQRGRELGLPANPATGSEKRVALIIGNADYENVGVLKNPLNDANDMAKVLQDLGFEVSLGLNQRLPQMRKLVREFGAKLQQTRGVGLFFYAGHGIQAGGRNYLIPVEAKIESEVETEDYALDVNAVLRQMDTAGNGFNIVILDACRNNPFARSWNRDVNSGGLAQIKAPTGTFIAYATQPDNVASDGKGRNGLYTGELLKVLGAEGLKLEEVFKEVRRGVVTASGSKQVPWDASSVTGDFYFNVGRGVGVRPRERPKPADEGPEPVITRRDPKELERDAWLLVRNSNDAQDFREFLELYPGGANAASAKIKLEQLAWEGARNNGSKAALEAYLKEFPTGDNAPTARLMLSRLARASQPPPVPSPSAPGRQQSNQYGIEFVALSAGTFTMGAPASEEGRSSDEVQHQVTISRPFGMGKYEVTQGQWQAVMGSNPSYFKDCAKCPVEQVSWEDAQQFIAKLNALKDGYTYRLPTEAEWEYAARAGSTGPYYSGTLDEVAWYSANSGNKTHPVGEKKANAWGLYDMHGNVWEWCSDWYGRYPSRAVTDPSGPSTGSYRVRRGGSWFNLAAHARAAARSYNAPGYRSSNLGFRLVRTPV